jgi:hypothetical protein
MSHNLPNIKDWGFEDKQHEHDCDNCEFLGTWTGAMHYDDKPKSYDLYVCNGPFEKTVIARYGSMGDYSSGLCFVAGNRALTEAFLRAERLGILKWTDLDGTAIQLLSQIAIDQIDEDPELILKRIRYKPDG